MTKKSVRKFLEDVKKDSALQDIRKGLSKGRTQVGLVNYLTEEANQRGYEFTALELEEELLPWLLSAQSELLETPQESIEGSGEKPPSIQESIEQPESIEGSGEKPPSIQEPIEKPESTKKSTQKLGKMATKKSTKASTEASIEASTEASTDASTEVSTEASTEVSIDASKKIADEIPTTSSSTVQMLSLMALPQPTQSLQEPTKKITALEKVLEKVHKGKLSDLNGRIWA
jgi:hypothetical protein